MATFFFETSHQVDQRLFVDENVDFFDQRCLFVDYICRHQNVDEKFRPLRQRLKRNFNRSFHVGVSSALFSLISYRLVPSVLYQNISQHQRFKAAPSLSVWTEIQCWCFVVAMADDIPVPLWPELDLYMKHVAKIAVVVQLPEIKSGSLNISNWEVMEKIRALIAPEEFTTLSVLKVMRQMLHFQGELASLRVLRKAIQLLNGKTIRVNGMSQQLRVRAGEAELKFPQKKDWDSYFQDRGVPTFAEGIPGDRPDTVYIRGIPAQWLCPNPVVDQTVLAELLKKIFSRYGSVCRVDVVDNPPQASSGSFSAFGPSAPLHTFDGYIQYEKYDDFCRTMAGLRGMKLVRKRKGEPEVAVKLDVDFDKSSHLSDRMVRKRRKEQEKLEELARQEREKQRLQREAEARRKEEEAQRERERKAEAARKEREAAVKRAERHRQQREKRRKEREERRQREKEQRRAARKAERERQQVEQQRRTEAECLLRHLLNMAAGQLSADQAAEKRRRQAEEEKERESARLKEEQRLREQETQAAIDQRDVLVHQVRAMEERQMALKKELLRKKLASERELLFSRVAADSSQWPSLCLFSRCTYTPTLVHIFWHLSNCSHHVNPYIHMKITTVHMKFIR